MGQPPARPPAPAKPARAGTGGSTGPSLFDFPTNDASASPSRAENPGYRTVRTRAELNAVIAALRAAPIFAIDTETTGLVAIDCHLCGVSLAVKPREGWYIPTRSPEPDSHLSTREVLDALRPLLEDPAVRKCGHNLKYDLLVLRSHGVELRGLASGGFDSMVASYLIDASRSSHSLDALALALLGHSNISLKELIGSGPNQKTFDQVDVALATQYAAEDADIALRLHHVMAPQLDEMGLAKLSADVEMPLVEVLAELEFNGVLVDPAELDRQRERLAGRIADLKAQIDDAAMASIGRTFNPESPKQLAAALFNKPDVQDPGLGLKPTKRTKTGFSTDIEVLEDLAEDPAVSTPIPKLILEHRQLTKLVGTYLVALKAAINPRTRRIHSSFSQTVAVTGRLASSDPNLQNIPIRSEVGREIRRAFVAPPGRVLVSADYSQIELRLLAHLSRDPALTEAFLSDQDIHTAVAAQVFGVQPDKVSREQRNGAKMVNFGIVYGVTPFGLARRLGVPTREAEEIITAYRKRFSGISTFLQECIEQARAHGFVETMLRRRRPIPDIDSNVPARRAAAERTAINSVVQGSAADLIKLAMNDLYARLSEHAAHLRDGRPAEVPGVAMLLQIHDELVFEADEKQAESARRLIVDRMEKAMTLSVPLKADSTIAGNWFDE